MKSHHCRWVSVLLLLAGFASPAGGQNMKPKVRALTAFVRIDPGNYQAQVRDALTLLRSAKDSYV